MASISVIIVNYNAGPRLLQCLNAVKAQKQKPEEIYVVDNGSTDGSFNAAIAHHSSIIGIEMNDNLGFAAANNHAATKASGDWLAFLNPDAYAEPSWLEELAAAIDRWPKARAFGSLQVNDQCIDQLDGAGDCLHAFGVPYRGYYGWPRSKAPEEAPVFAACAAAALVKRSTFLALGGFDERFFCYCEDVDLGFRLRLAGWETVQVPSAVVRHEGSGISGEDSPFTVYHGHRNRHWLFAKSLPTVLFWTLFPLQMLLTFYVMLRISKEPIAKDYRRGVSDGLRGVLALRKAYRHQPRRKLSSLRILKLLTWSPRALKQRRGKSIPPIAQ